MAKGIDIPINSMVTEFTDNLWTTKTRNFKGRIYRIEREGILPCYYNGTDYVPMLFDDNNDAHCFFDVLPDRSVEILMATANVRICFAVNLATLYTSVTGERATEYAIEDAYKLLRYSRFEISGIVTGVEAFSDYEIDQKDNLQPLFLFRFDTELNFSINEC